MFFGILAAGLLANMLYASGLGTLQLGRVAMRVSEEEPGVPRITAMPLRRFVLTL